MTHSGERGPPWLGRTRRVLESADSTQRVLLDRVRARCAEDGELVLARRQTAGRGRRGRTWFAPPEGALAFSFALVPAGPAEALPLGTLATALGAAEAVEIETGLACRLKWPNDILARGRKLGGVLAEASASGGAAEWAVVGVGLNVNVAEEVFPPELRASATSVLIELGRAVKLDAILERFLERAGLHLGRVRSGTARATWEAVAARLHGLGARVRVEPDAAGAPERAQRLQGRVAGIDPAGRLRLVLDSGRERLVSSGRLTGLEGRDG